MLNMKVDDNQKTIYVEVNGYINSNEARSFLNNYKQQLRTIKAAQYKLVVTPSVFECENEADVRNICMSFFKAGHRSMYLVDPNNYISSMMNLGKFEQKMFNKAVKVVPSISQIK